MRKLWRRMGMSAVLAAAVAAGVLFGGCASEGGAELPGGDIGGSVVVMPEFFERYCEGIEYRFTLASEEDCPAGQIKDSCLKSNILFRAGTYFLVLDLRFSSFSWLSEEQFDVAVTVASLPDFSATLQEAPTGEVKEEILGRTKQLTASFRKPERQQQRYRIVYKIDAAGEAVLTATVHISGAGEHENLFTAGIDYTFSLNPDGVSYAVTGINDAEDIRRLAIPAQFNALPVTSIAEGAFRGCSGLEELYIPASVTEVERGCLLGCTSLNKLTLPSLSGAICTLFGEQPEEVPQSLHELILTGQKQLYSGALEGCGGLTSLILPADMTAMAEGSLRGCNALSCLSFPAVEDLSGRPVTLGGLFGGIVPDCLGEANVLAGKVGKGAFENCTSLRSVTLLPAVTEVGEAAFSGCSGLKQITLSPALTSLPEKCFSACSGLSEVELPAGIREIGASAFAGCSSLREIALPEELTHLNFRAFSGCNALFSVAFGEGDSDVSVGEEAFLGCSALKTLFLKGSGAFTMGKNAFSGCTALREVHIADIAAWCRVTFKGGASDPLALAGHLFSEGREVTALNIPSGVTSVSSGAFSGCTWLTQVFLPAGLSSIGTSAFAGCIRLIEVWDGAELGLQAGQSDFGSVALYAKQVHRAGEEGRQQKTADGFLFYEGEERYLLGHMGQAQQALSLPASTPSGQKYALWPYAFTQYEGLREVEIGEGVTAIGHHAFAGCSELETLTVGSEVSSVGEEAFAGCTALQTLNWNARGCADGGFSLWPPFEDCIRLQTIHLGQGVERIPAYLFSHCEALGEVEIPSSVMQIGDGAFAQCNMLTSLRFEAENCLYAGSSNGLVFSGCNALSALTLGEGVTNLPDFLFSGLSHITEVKLPVALTAIGAQAFFGCGLREVEIPASVGRVSADAFSGCASLASVCWNAEQCTTQNSVFSDCPALQSASFGENVQKIPDFLFKMCSALREVFLPATLVSVGESAFSSCTGLSAVQLPATLSSLESNAFSGCTGLLKVQLPASLVSLGNNAFSGCTGLLEAEIGEKTERIGSSAFWGCSALNTVLWRARNCTSAGNYSDPVFRGCGKLSTLLVEEGVETIPANAFRGCTGLKMLSLPSSLKLLQSGAFSGCTGLNEVTLPASLTSLGEGVFSDCSALTSLRFEAENCIGGAPVFSGCNALFSVTFGERVKVIPAYLFSGLRAITAVQLPASVASVGANAFAGCTNLKQVGFPASLSEIGAYAFRGCSGLSQVQLPASLSALGASAFSGCTGLSEVEIPFGLKEIGGYAFYGCTSLASVDWKPRRCTYTSKSALPPFEGCISLTKIGFGGEVEVLPGYLFAACTAISETELPASVTEIGICAFEGCTGLEAITFAREGNLSAIKWAAFSGCTALERLYLPQSLIEIDVSAFYGCTSLKEAQFADPTGWVAGGQPLTGLEDGAYAAQCLVRLSTLAWQKTA